MPTGRRCGRCYSPREEPALEQTACASRHACPPQLHPGRKHPSTRRLPDFLTQSLQSRPTEPPSERACRLTSRDLQHDHLGAPGALRGSALAGGAVGAAQVRRSRSAEQLAPSASHSVDSSADLQAPRNVVAAEGAVLRHYVSSEPAAWGLRRALHAHARWGGRTSDRFYHPHLATAIS